MTPTCIFSIAFYFFFPTMHWSQCSDNYQQVRAKDEIMTQLPYANAVVNYKENPDLVYHLDNQKNVHIILIQNQ